MLALAILFIVGTITGKPNAKYFLIETEDGQEVKDHAHLNGNDYEDIRTTMTAEGIV